MYILLYDEFIYFFLYVCVLYEVMLCLYRCCDGRGDGLALAGFFYEPSV